MSSSRVDLREHVKSVLEACQCVVEERPGLISAIVSPEVQHVFDHQDFVELAHIHYGSAILESLRGVLSQKGRAALRVYDGLYLKQADWQQELTKHWQWIHLKPVWQAVRRSVHSYLILYVKYRAVADDRQEGMVVVALNEHTLCAPTGLIAALRQNDFFQEHLPDTLADALEPRQNIRKALAAALAIAEHQAQQASDSFMQRLSRRRGRDHQRLDEYYGNLRLETTAHLQRKQEKGDDVVSDEAKLAAIDREHGLKIADLGEKYAVRVELRPLCAERVIIPVAVSSVKILQGKLEHHQDIVWNALTKEFDPLVCVRCGVSMISLHACPQWHWLCTSCAAPCQVCGKKLCRACTALCPRCGT